MIFFTEYLQQLLIGIKKFKNHATLQRAKISFIYVLTI